MANTLRLKVFVTGRVAVETDGAVIDEAHLGGRQGRLLFAYLVAERSRPVPRDELAEALWGETPPVTRDKALTVIASKLRAALGDAGLDGRELLTAAFGCYRLDLPEGTWVDLFAAASGARDAEDALAAGDLARARAAAGSVESLVRRPFLPGEDPAGARALWQRVDREVTDAALWVPLIASKDVNFLSKRVGNYQFSPDGNGMLVDQLWVR